MLSDLKIYTRPVITSYLYFILGTTTSAAITEVQRYVEESILGRQQDPLLWWIKHQHSYPTLSKLVVRKFNMLATSVPCERVFSKAGNVVSERRSRLSSQHVEKLLFLNSNSYLLKHA
jgi:uncharacterized membrane protein